MYCFFTDLFAPMGQDQIMPEHISYLTQKKLCWLKFNGISIIQYFPVRRGPAFCGISRVT